MKKISHRSHITVWPSPSVPCGLGFLVSKFRVRPGQRREEVQLYSAHWWCPTDWAGILSHQQCCRHTAAELDLEMRTEPLLAAKSGVRAAWGVSKAQ